MLDAELAKIRSQASDPMLRAIRTQFWREALYENEGGGHELARDLIACFSADQLMFAKLDRLILAHEKFQDEEALLETLSKEYCERQAALFELAHSYLLGGESERSCDFYLQCGKAYGGGQFICRHRPLFIGNEEHGQRLLHQTGVALEEISADLRKLAPRGRAAVLPLALAAPYLDLYQTSDRAGGQAIDLHAARKLWLLWRAIRKGFD